ncbi:MAG TPA: pyruvate kinase [Bryobacteraceae bacterium]|nr:pyruvate kinase [Bryobacteraceae bacterium]
MDRPFPRRTKIVATLGPASSSPEMIRRMILAGMDVARLNFSHGSHDGHARTISLLRTISAEMKTPVTIMQDLQGPKVRVGSLPGGEMALRDGDEVAIIPEAEFDGRPATIPIDYAHAAEEAQVGMRILMADGLLELSVEGIDGNALRCRVVRGGALANRKGVNFPALNLNLPSLTEKDVRDLEFGLDHGVDVVSLSFVRAAKDVHLLEERISAKGLRTPIVAKIERPQAIDNLEDILSVAQGVMVARGDLGVEMSPEKVPMLQKRIIERCNRRGLPVITATQMLESMVREPRPTRAEASDVANAIIDGTDAVMLSGESATGAYPVEAVEMMARIAVEVESGVEFRSYPAEIGNRRAMAEAAKALARAMDPACVAVFADRGDIPLALAAGRLRTPVVVLTTDAALRHALNLVWGVRPVLIPEMPSSAAGYVACADAELAEKDLASSGNHVVVLGGMDFIQVHRIA